MIAISIITHIRDINKKFLRNLARKEMWKLFTEFEKLLKENKTTIYRASKDTGIPQTALYEWKSGRCTPKVDKMIKIARYFDVPLETLVEERG